MKKISLAVFIIAFALFSQSCKQDTEEQVKNAAKVMFAIGDVQVKEADRWVNALENMILYQGNELKTGKDSQCNLQIGSDSFISIKEKSHLVLESLFKTIDGEENSTVTLQVGRSVINPKKLLKGEQFQVKTPTAIAAVRGTKFVVESNPRGRMKVSVVDGKVELKRRIPALEEVEEKLIKKSEALTTLQEKVEIERVIVDANESAFIDNKKAVQENKVIEKIITQHVSEIEAVTAIIEDIKTDTAEDKAEVARAGDDRQKKIEDFKTRDVKVKNVLANLSIMKKKEKELVQIKREEKVETKDIKAVKELDTVIQEVKEKEKVQSQAAREVKEEKPVTELTIGSPVKKSAIYVNNRFKGYDTITISPEPGEKQEIRVSAYGYDDFNAEAQLKSGEKKSIAVTFNKSPVVTISSPVKNSSIYVNSKFVGRDAVSIPQQSGEDITVTVRARGFKAFRTELTVKKGDNPVIKADMVRIVALKRVKWIKNINTDLRVRPVYYKNKLILASGNGKVVATSRDGKKIWLVDLKRRIESTPVAALNVVYVINNSGDFYALNVNDGSVKWKIKLEGSLLFGSQPVITKERIYVATTFGRVYALKLNGKTVWCKDLENGIYASPVLHKGSLFVGAEDRNMYSLDAEKGSIQWIFSVDGRMVSAAPVVSGDILYVGCYSGSFFAIDGIKGNLVWKFKTGDAIISTPVIKDNYIYVGSNDGTLYALQSKTGTVQWKFQTGSRVETKPSILGDNIFVTSGNSVYALDVNSGAEQWKQDFDRQVKTSATVIGNDLIIGLDGGSLAALRNSLIRSYE